MGRWKKLGRIFQPPGKDWMLTHAQNPFCEILNNGIFRIHFSSRDHENQSRGGYVILDFNEDFKIIEVSERPTIDLGSLGAFDDSGAMPSMVLDYNGNKYMYYTGWSRAVNVPFLFFIGLAVSEDNGKTFTRWSNAPVLGRNSFDPFITGSPYVIHDHGSFKMWYVSAIKWVKETGLSKPKHYYTIKYANSTDGINWITNDHICMPFKEGEYAIARPVVFKEDEKYKMWFTFRGGANSYQIGVAESEDGIQWERSDEILGIDVSVDDWDSEMICYAHPLYFNGDLYALYNGNDYGKTGFGLAIWINN